MKNIPDNLKLMKFLYLLPILIVITCCNVSEKDNFSGDWIIEKTSLASWAGFKNQSDVTVHITKDGHFYNVNYIIKRDGKTIDMNKELLKEKHASGSMEDDVMKKMFVYELSQDGNFLVNVLDKTRILTYNAREDLITCDTFGEGLLMERK